jgi:hypothetical protein
MMMKMMKRKMRKRKTLNSRKLSYQTLDSHRIITLLPIISAQMSSLHLRSLITSFTRA